MTKTFLYILWSCVRTLSQMFTTISYKVLTNDAIGVVRSEISIVRRIISTGVLFAFLLTKHEKVRQTLLSYYEPL